MHNSQPLDSKLVNINESRKLTIVLTMREDEKSILIGSDSHTHDTSGIESIVEKLHLIPSTSIVWGYAGCLELSYKFHEWVNNQIIPSEWASFEKSIRNHLADINREQREYVARSGAKWNEEYGLDCLLAGWFKDNPFMIKYEDTGTVEDYLFQGIGAIGAGRHFAAVAYTTLSSISNITPEQRFRIILDTAIRKAPNCKFPMYIWRITPESAKLINKVES